MQVPVATSTPTHILEDVAKRVDAFLRANRNEYTGSRECVYKDVQDVWPVRTIIFIAWQYTHTGELLACTSDLHNSLLPRVGQSHCLGVGVSSGPCAINTRYACILEKIACQLSQHRCTQQNNCNMHKDRQLPIALL